MSTDAEKAWTDWATEHLIGRVEGYWRLCRAAWEARGERDAKIAEEAAKDAAVNADDCDDDVEAASQYDVAKLAAEDIAAEIRKQDAK